MMINPWKDIKTNCYKRIVRDLNLFYAKSLEDNYLLIIELDNDEEKNISLSLKGFELFQLKDNGKYKILLQLKEEKNWEIFCQLCQDLVMYAQKSRNFSSKSVISRLIIWQSFLSDENNDFPFEKQLGLMGELTFLYYHLAEKVSLKQAIIAWVGPEKEKQDFRINGINIEVKSYLDNKRETVCISSLEQLNPQNGELFLYAIGFKLSKDGNTLKDCYVHIREMILENCSDELNRFEKLISEYGFSPYNNYNNLEKFQVFESNCWAVKDNFPRLPLNVKNDAITNIKYQLNLALCKDFKKSDSFLYSKIKEGA